MKSKDIFNVAVRIIGLAFLYQGLTSVPAAVIHFCPIFPPPPWKYLNFRGLLPDMLFIFFPLLIAWWMVRGAPWLMRLAYPEERAQSPAAEKSSGAEAPR